MKNILTMAMVTLLTMSAFAQQDLTLYNARYLQQASFTNAAFTPECKVNIGGILFGSTYMRAGHSGMTVKRLGMAFEGPEGASKALGQLKDLSYLDLEFRKDIIHFGFRIKQKNYVSFNTSLRSQTVGYYPRDFATLMFLGNGISADDPVASEVDPQYLLLGNRANFDGVGLDHTTYAEVGIQYARKLLEDDALSIGIRPKLLLGLANIYTEQSEFGLTTDENTYAWTLDGSYRYNSSLPFTVDSNGVDMGDVKPFGNLGFGVDLGASYNITEKINVSASANDLGFINWKNNPRNFEAQGGEMVFGGLPVDGRILQVSDYLDSLSNNAGEILLDSVNSQFGADTTFDDYRTTLTARYNIGLNYEFAENHNVGVLLNAHRLKSRMRAAFNVSYNYRLPKWVGFHANYSIYNNSFANLGLGLSLNIFPWNVYVMTDNALFFLKSTTTTMVRGGINWNIGCTQDRDKDGIPDKEDNCPDTPGEAKFKGCPDTDKDGIMDKEDMCPETPGLKELQGCPDRDGDGIVDKEDDCPDAPGIKEFNGCPDTDEDGIMDSEDACPTVAGVPEFNGCPDTDKDGIQDSEDDCPEKPGIPEFNGCPDTDADGLKDSEDECPERAGPIEQNGCPDTDQDGLTDNKDNCPETPGPVDNQGCPFGDRDGDGIIDNDDSCPDAPGPEENAGCPYSDLDGDGVFDKDDRCPQTPGIVENEGCPEIKKEEQEVLNTAFDNLEFETGKDVIKASSYESLDRLAELLIKKETWKLEIAGHTDDVGSDAANMKLSEQRAKSVGKYLESRGVDPGSLIIKWFGETQPIADNDTPEGRSQNRRVEMEVMFD